MEGDCIWKSNQTIKFETLKKLQNPKHQLVHCTAEESNFSVHIDLC